MDNFFQRFRTMAITSVILTFILFIWFSVDYIESFIKIFNNNGFSILVSLLNFTLSWLQFVATCICILILNIMIIQNKKDKVLLLILIIFGLVLSGLLVITRVSNFINSLYYLFKSISNFGVTTKQFFLLLITGSIFIITLDQFKHIIKYFKNETAN